MNSDEKVMTSEGGETTAATAAAAMTSSTTTTATNSNAAHEATTTTTATTSSTAATATDQHHPPVRRTRSAVRSLIQRYFYQLQNGCGNEECKNVNCASSGKVASMTANDMAAKAIQLFSQDAQLCETDDIIPIEITPISPITASSASSSSALCASKVPRTENTLPTASTHESPSTSSTSQFHHGSDVDMVSPIESSCSSTSTITTSSSTSSTSTSTTSSASTPSVQSPNAAHEEAMPFLELIAVATKRQQKGKRMIKKTSSLSRTSFANVEKITVEMVEDLIQEGKQSGSYSAVICLINEIFSSIERLSRLFYQTPDTTTLATTTSTATTRSSTENKLRELLSKSPCELKKEDLRTLEGENDKDEDCTQHTPVNQRQLQAALDQVEAQRDDNESHGFSADDESEPMDAEEEACSSSWAKSKRKENNSNSNNKVLDASNSETNVDFELLRRIKVSLFNLEHTDVIDAIATGASSLSNTISCGLEKDWEKVLHCVVIFFDILMSSANTRSDTEYMEQALPKICQAAADMPVNAQARLARIWAAHCGEHLEMLLQCIQQLITIEVIFDEEHVRENIKVTSCTKVLKIVFYANMLAGKLEVPSSLVIVPNAACKLGHPSTSSSAAAANINNDDDDDDLFYYSGMSRPHMPKFAEDKLEKALHVSNLDCRVPLLPFEDFYNETLSDAIQMHHDYLSYKNLSLDRDGDDSYFTFMLYAFILTPASKVIALYYDSRMRMYSERNSTLYSILNSFGDGHDISSRPDLKLTVRRDNLIDDALVGLELVAMSNPKDLKKQLVVEFMGEQGIDEGGVSKEFFQLIVEEIFNPDFGMFMLQEDTNTMWFNPSPFENDAQFTLIGIILGLAIYNNVILAVNFPMVVYRKLMGCRGTFYDLKDWNPTLYRSLQSLLDYKEHDMDDVFMQTFKISYANVFGDLVEHELMPNGGNIIVDQHNKKEFVNLYSDYLLNLSIERQFKAFKKGFEMVTDESPLKLLFRPEEIELLVCGSKKFDFIELEKSTEYDGGYTSTTQIIKDFWSIVHSLNDDSKRKLLEFTTGSDRVPVGGLSRLRLLITRNGPDSERLPTSHTCFNVLLLPEYSSKEKLEERLLKAINYSKGFGML